MKNRLLEPSLRTPYHSLARVLPAIRLILDSRLERHCSQLSSPIDSSSRGTEASFHQDCERYKVTELV